MWRVWRVLPSRRALQVAQWQRRDFLQVSWLVRALLRYWQVPLVLPGQRGLAGGSVLEQRRLQVRILREFAGVV
jgi:hypothetical protein